MGNTDTNYKVETNYIDKDYSLKEALEIINHISDDFPSQPLTLLITDNENRLLGTLTDGDIRRKLVSGIKLTDSVESCMNRDFTFIQKNGLEYHNVIRYRQNGIRLLPLLDKDGRILKIYNLSEMKSILPIEAVIMAGGEGTRLRPLTYDTPKPLLKVGNKSIIERNIDRLITYGIENITISIRYLGDQIVSRFGNGNDKGINIRYVREDDPLGTAGGLSLIDDFKSETILLTNSDILTTLDYEEFYNDFVEHGADISIVTIPYRVKVPYGVFVLENDKVSALKEKPEYTYYSNAGIYLIKRKLIDQIPKNKPLDITDFIEQQIASGKTIRSFPFWGYWLDIGKHEDYENAQKAIQILESF
jgi:dTDP-glucose pyrophosphorylase